MINVFNVVVLPYPEAAELAKKSKSGTSDDLLPKGVALSSFNPSDSSEISIKVQPGWLVVVTITCN